jgi:hypothetical protein
MKLTQRLYCVPLLGLLFLNNCPQKNPATDTTSPSINPFIQIGAPPPDTITNGINFAGGDVTKSGIPSNLKIRLIAQNWDSESGVTSFTLTGTLSWQCAMHGSEIEGVPQTKALTLADFVGGVTSKPTDPVSVFDGVLDPIAIASCSTAKQGWGSVDLKGSFRLVAVNGAKPTPLTTTSSAFNFDYQDVGHR